MAQAIASRFRFLHILNTVLSLGLNLLIARLGLNPRWRYAVWTMVILNELRGIAVVAEVGKQAILAVT